MPSAVSIRTRVLGMCLQAFLRSPSRPRGNAPRARFSLFLSALGTALLALPLVPALPTRAIAETTEVRREVPYLTVRNRTGSSQPSAHYGDERSGLKAGRCGLNELDLGVLSPVADAVPVYVQEELLRVDRVQEMTVDALFDELEITAADGGPVLYTHGFYIDFEKGCRRAALLQENAGLEGRFLWFSWPSDGSLINYTHDEADLYWSVPDLANAIATMVERFPGDRVDVAGHSLGARGVVLALYELANRAPDLRLGEVVLLAPDMDFDIFRRMLPRIRPIVRNMTIYVTSGDRPLALSEQVHGYPRLGQAGNDVALLEGVDVIDLSDLPARSPTGHLYHIYNREVGDDLNQILAEEKPARSRRNLIRTDRNLWRFDTATGTD